MADVLRRLLVARLILPVLASVALVELLAGVLVWRTVSTRQETMIGGLANRITLVLEETQQDVQAVARLGAEPEQLTFLLAAAPQIERIYRSDAQGRLLAMQPPNDAYLDFDLSNQPFSTLPLAEQSAVFGGPYTSPLSGRQTLFLAAPLPDGGRLVADIGLEFLEQQMQASMAVEQGNASVAFYNAQGQQVVANRAVFAPVPESGPAVSMRDTTFWLTSRKAAGPQGWNVVVQSPMMQQGFLLVAAALALFIVPLIALLFMLRYSRSLERAIANPLRLLNERTRQLAGGDYTRWISFATVSASFNEVAELADSFERMQHAIQQRQAALQVSEARFREMAELLPDMMVELDAARRIRYANRAALNRVLHCENGQLFDRTLAADDTHALQMLCRQAAGSDGNHPVVLRFLRPEGGTFPGELALTASRGADGSLLGYRGVVRDITERLSFEESLRRSYRLFTEGPVVMFRVNAAGDQPVEYVSPNVTQFGCRPYDFKTRDDYVERLVHPVDRARMRAERAARQDSDAAFFEAEYRIVSVDGAMRWVYDFTSVSRAPDGSPGHYDWYILDITERKRAEERIGKQLQRMAALQLVDSSITANADLSLTLHLLVTQLIELLEINAAVVLRYEAQSQSLDYCAGVGFTSGDGSAIRLSEGESFAGQAALRRERILIMDAPEELAKGFKYAWIREEGYSAFCALPLIAKDQVQGVLEVFSRKPLGIDPEWLDFLDAMASQAAIAIYNARLLENLQRSNEELRQAYQATIVGLSHALELRDKETEGHSQRVSELAVGLAQRAGVPEEELEFVRIGALLHDIGKLGVPDQILNKEGRLDEEEWVIMRRHPENAARMLAAIDYLRPALAIPQYHHERWDGSGYPYGLVGETIPLTARVFAIVDVWDALSFDRPYRPAWAAEQVCAYLREESGRKFDPRLVDLFFDLLQEQALLQCPPMKESVEVE